MDDTLLSEVEAAAILGVHPKTLGAWRKAGTGPPWFRIGPKLIRYREEAVRGWPGAAEVRLTPPPAPVKPAKAPRKPRREPFDALAVQIPKSLSGPNFQAKWEEFVAYRRDVKKKPFLTEKGPKAAFRHLEPLGRALAIEALEITMEKQWEGVEYGVQELMKRTPGLVQGRAFGRELARGSGALFQTTRQEGERERLEDGTIRVADLLKGEE